MQTNPFATEATEYAHLRPTYPDKRFEFLATVLTLRDVAWDCATGNGQAATHLTRHFGWVIATDESGEMITQAPRHTRITYRVAEAEDCGLEDHSVDLVTVASAIHWFGLKRFYAESARGSPRTSIRLTPSSLRLPTLRGSYSDAWRAINRRTTSSSWLRRITCYRAPALCELRRNTSSRTFVNKEYCKADGGVRNQANFGERLVYAPG